MERCQGESYCKGYPDKCHELCIGYVQLYNIYSLSFMPKKYQYGVTLNEPGKDLDAFVFLKEWMADVENHLLRGDGLFLFSETKGNGKTSWACKIMNEHFKNVALKNNMTCRGIFINVPEFLQEMRDSFSRDEVNYELLNKIHAINTCELVVWDDIGTETPTNWVRERLYTYINRRESNGLSQIFTSNLPLEVLEDEKYLGGRIVSRIVGCCHLIEFFNKVDRRVNK